MSTTHQAAIVPQKGGPLAIVQRETPTPAPNELLIQVHAVALNPVDIYQRDRGMFITDYPAVLGSDVSGIVAKVGSSVTLAPGTRVTAFASAFMHQGSPDYGALQRYVLVHEEMVTILPESYSFTEGSVFPHGCADLVERVVVGWGSTGSFFEGHGRCLGLGGGE